MNNDDKLLSDTYTEITPLVMDEYPEAQNVWLKVGVQSFCVTPAGCEDMDQAEFIQRMLATALSKIINANNNIELAMARSEAEDCKRAATRLADALTDINNDIGEMAEVKARVDTVQFSLESYAGLCHE